MLDITDRRTAPRERLTARVQFLLRGNEEYVGELLDISECGAALITNAQAAAGDEIVIYVERVGRLKGSVARNFQRGFAVAFNHSPAHRKTIGKRIAAAIEGRSYLRLSEERDAVRIDYNIETMLHLPGQTEPIPCRLANLSQTGCFLRMNVAPPIGTKVIIGKFSGVIVRHCDDGVGIDFCWGEQEGLKYRTIARGGA